MAYTSRVRGGSKAYAEGYKAYPMTRRDRNPYDDGTPGNPLAAAWDSGWEDHRDQPTQLTEMGL